MSQNPSLEAKMAQKRESRVSTAPESVRMLLRRVFAGQSPRSGCVKAMCLECNGFDRAAITDCTAYACPLWNVRPYQAKKAFIPIQPHLCSGGPP